MAFDDKKFGTLFPTRFGEATGTANERQMLDVIGGSESFRTRIRTLADGSEVMLRTKNGNPQFSTVRPSINEVVKCSLEMDSGVLDLLGYGDNDPNTYQPAKIYSTDYVANHTASAINGKAVGCGKINSKDATGPVVANGADASGYKDDGSYTHFVDKKKLAIKVPSSLFTGRTRLYVQSLFGGNWSSLFIDNVGLTRPILSVNSRNRKYSQIPDVNIGSGCGLYLDPTTKMHWLLIPTETQVIVMPLKATDCAEKFRKLLLSSTLSDADKERVESYILAHSIPIPEKSQIMAIDSTPSEALGYSWHWNWDGTKCDIVDVQEVLMGDGNWGFTTTHYNLTFSVLGGSFSVTRNIVVGPETFSVPKHMNVIAYPNWYENKLQKAGNIPSGLNYTEARSGRIYCFYAKNDLKTVDYVGAVASEQNSRSSSLPRYGGTKYESTPGFHLFTYESGYTTARAAWTGYKNTFTCDGVSVGDVFYNTTVNHVQHDWDGRERITAVDGSPYINPELTGYSAEFGKPQFTETEDELGTVSISHVPESWGMEYVPPPLIPFFGWSVMDWWKVTYESYEENHISLTLVVIPFGDAEAVYLNDDSYTRKIGSLSTSRQYMINGDVRPIWIGWIYSASMDLAGNRYDKELPVYNLTNDPSSNNSGLKDETVKSGATSKLICAHGVSDANGSSRSIFYQSNDSVAQFYWTVTSVNGVIRSKETNIEEGSPFFPFYSSIVGWA